MKRVLGDWSFFLYVFGGVTILVLPPVLYALADFYGMTYADFAFLGLVSFGTSWAIGGWWITRPGE